jgi:cobalamin biosynthetic protein CobC
VTTLGGRDHGGGLDAAIHQYGGHRDEWLDLSTGINPVAYPVEALPIDCWTALPDTGAALRVEEAARSFWGIPTSASVLVAGGASALIAQMPTLAEPGRVQIFKPTYNEHEAAFLGAGWTIADQNPDAVVLVHPNNPDGQLWTVKNTPTARLRIIDESFCDVRPHDSLIALAKDPGTLVLKSFGKFWGLAGVRLGFAIGDSGLIAQLKDRIGPWAASGPALELGHRALCNTNWADTTRERLAKDAARLDAKMQTAGAHLIGGTDLFRLFEVDDAAKWQDRLARHRIWSRIFPYSKTWLRLGLPNPDRWEQLEAAL